MPHARRHRHVGHPVDPVEGLLFIPMLIQMVTLPLFYDSLLGGNPANVIKLAGTLLMIAAVCVLFVKVAPAQPER